MSDAARYAAQTSPRQQLQNIPALLSDIFDKAAALATHAGITLRFTNYPQSVISLADTEKLARAVYNIVSNAIKFSQGGHISAKLSRHGNKLQLRIKDNGSGIPDEVFGTIFSRHLRGIHPEDSRYGIGLGMVLVRNAAATHGGTVLVQRLPEGGTSMTITLAIRKHTGDTVTSPIQLPDYAGGFDHALMELADVLPPEAYQWK
jgi:signal transduction histidine kinase